jgi:hypothetical protein
MKTLKVAAYYHAPTTLVWTCAPFLVSWYGILLICRNYTYFRADRSAQKWRVWAKSLFTVSMKILCRILPAFFDHVRRLRVVQRRKCVERANYLRFSLPIRHFETQSPKYITTDALYRTGECCYTHTHIVSYLNIQTLVLLCLTYFCAIDFRILQAYQQIFERRRVGSERSHARGTL